MKNPEFMKGSITHLSQSFPLFTFGLFNYTLEAIYSQKWEIFYKDWNFSCTTLWLLFSQKVENVGLSRLPWNLSIVASTEMEANKLFMSVS